MPEKKSGFSFSCPVFVKFRLIFLIASVFFFQILISPVFALSDVSPQVLALQGKVFDAKTNEPLAGALVSAKTLTSQSSVSSALTDEQGYYTLKLKLKERNSISAESSFFVKVSCSKDGYEDSDSLRLKLKRSQRTYSLDIRLSPASPPGLVLPEIIITSPQDGVTVNEKQIKLEGTVDGVVFSEDRVLSEGKNILTKTAINASGNSASASVTVYLNSAPCVLIGPDGGEVVSSNGKVKLVIPKDALIEPACISISSLNNANFQGLVPQDASLLSIVECKPYNLTFNKPVQIIYTLDSAQVPGTAVKLGIFDGGRISFTSDPAIVPVDGYNLSFTIRHFSTYAALRDFISQGAPIGAGVKIPLPDLLTGAFSHSVALTIPPGRKGVQPALALNYRSGSGNSWTGVGYNLNCGYIVRSTRLGPAKYIDHQDAFYLITDTGTTELINLADNLYQAKVENSFTKYYKEADDTWRVVAKDGSVLRFGQDSDSKENSSSGTFAWYLTKAVDNNGNFVKYNYTKDQGKPYLSHIDYTGNENGVSPENTVEFSLESRDDIYSSYISGSKVAVAKRLKEARAKSGGDLAWRYVFEYSYSPDTHRSLLKSITQYGGDDKSLPAQKFSYQSAK